MTPPLSAFNVRDPQHCMNCVDRYSSKIVKSNWNMNPGRFPLSLKIPNSYPFISTAVVATAYTFTSQPTILPSSKRHQRPSRNPQKPTQFSVSSILYFCSCRAINIAYGVTWYHQKTKATLLLFYQSLNTFIT